MCINYCLHFKATSFIRGLACLAPSLWFGVCAQTVLTDHRDAPGPLINPIDHPAAQPQTTDAKSINWLHGLQIGVGVSHALHREPGIMQVQGPRLGVWGTFSLPMWHQWEPNVQVSAQSSAMHYSSETSGTLSQVPDHELDLRMTALQSLFSGKARLATGFQLGAYLGLGYRWHYNDLRGMTSKNHVGYRRVNRRLYWPLGLQLTKLDPKKMSVRLEYAPVVHGVQVTHMTDVGAQQDAKVAQKSYGWAVHLGWQLQSNWRLVGYHRRWVNQATDSWLAVTPSGAKNYHEPKGQWQETGLKLERLF